MNNIAELFTQHRERPERVLYRHFTDGAWSDITVAAVGELAARWQSAFARAGFAAGDRIAIGLRNGPHWVAIDLAALASGFVVVPLYVDDNAENLAHCIGDSGARLVIVETQRMKAALERTGIAHAPTIIALKKTDETGNDTGAEAFIAGANLGAETVTFEIKTANRAALATICYTSGTSGRPKGVMLSHGNILANVESIQRLHMAHESDVFLSFLPLSHMFERTGGYYLPLALGAKVIYARGIAQLGEDLSNERPTAIFAVPRVFEKFAERIRATFAEPGLRKRAFEACVERGYRLARGEGSASDRVIGPILRAAIARPILARFGGRLRLAVLGGAAMDPGIARLFMGLGLPVLQGYGMTEAAPVLTVNLLWDNDPESVGRALPGVEIRLGEHQEILAKGDNIMLGYWRNEAATAQAKDPADWLRTGDLGEIREGRVYIRGRIKDILVLSNGEKLPPQDAEIAILGDAVFEQVVLIGEGRPYLGMIAVTRDGNIEERELVRRANERLKSFPRYVRVRRAIRSSEPWTIESGELTPTLKVRRDRVIEQFKEEIERMYASDTASAAAREAIEE